MSRRVYNWGIIGAGNISWDFANAMTKHPRCNLAAVASRNKDTSTSFANDFNIAKPYTSYDDIINDKDIDIIYIGTYHPSHYPNVMRCLDAKKHVICEKPIGMNANQVKEMTNLSKKRSKFLLEAVWTRYFPAVRDIRRLIYEENAIGKPIGFMGDFGINIPHEQIPRLWEKELGGGGTLDLGIYVVTPLTLYFGQRMPSKIQAMGGIVNGVDAWMSSSLQYDKDQFASINCNLYANTPEEHSITGDKGSIIIHYPAHCPTSFTLKTFGNASNEWENKGFHRRDVVKTTKYDYLLPTGFKYNNFKHPGSEGLFYEIEEIVNCLDQGLIESPEFTHEESIITAQVFDEIRRQIGVEYPKDIEKTL